MTLRTPNSIDAIDPLTPPGARHEPPAADLYHDPETWVELPGGFRVNSHGQYTYAPDTPLDGTDGDVEMCQRDIK